MPALRDSLLEEVPVEISREIEEKVDAALGQRTCAMFESKFCFMVVFFSYNYVMYKGIDA